MTETVPDILVDTSRSKTDSRWQVLAGLRFLLAMVVVSGHLTWFAPTNAAPPFLGLLGGTSAVIGFLFVSGYSISHSIQRKPKGFYKRRVLRIYPLYVAAVLYALVPFLSGADALRTMDPLVTIPRPAMMQVVGNLLMLQNLVCRPVESNMLVWTLGIEVICYLFAPLLRRMPMAGLWALVAVSAFAFGWYPRLKMDHYATLLYGLPLLMFAWAWITGMLLQRAKRSLLVGAVIAVLGGALMVINTTYHAPYSVHTVVGAAVVVTMAKYVTVPRMLGGMLNYLGDLSYPVYLFHLPTFLAGYCVMGVQSQTSLVAMALGVSAGFLFVDGVLKPVLSVKRRNGSRSKSNVPFG